MSLLVHAHTVSWRAEMFEGLLVHHKNGPKVHVLFLWAFQTNVC